jgi:hypothetical protein
LSESSPESRLINAVALQLNQCFFIEIGPKDRPTKTWQLLLAVPEGCSDFIDFL